MKLYNIDTCPNHDLKYINRTKSCAACLHEDRLTPDLLEALRKCEEHPPGSVLLISRAFFDPREHCFTCSEKLKM